MIFERRHYEWLAKFAATQLPNVRTDLRKALMAENPKFNPSFFNKAIAREVSKKDLETLDV